MSFPDPFERLAWQQLLLVGVLFAGLAALTQMIFKSWSKDVLSPLHLALIVTMGICILICVVKNISVEAGRPYKHYWRLMTVGFAVLVLIEVLDLSGENLLTSQKTPLPGDLDWVVDVGLAAVLVGFGFMLRLPNLLRIGLLATAAFCLFNAAMEEADFWSPIFGSGNLRWIGMWVQVGMLLCLETFMASAYLLSAREDVLPQQFDLNQVGDHARRFFKSQKVQKAARHPPVRVAYYPLFKEATVFGTILYLLFTAGRGVKRAMGKGLRAQANDMVKLWFRDGIDPPTYYAMELYRPHKFAQTAQLLTRYETKNGVLATLNRARTNPHGANEMADKALFSACCASAGIAHPAVLAVIANGQLQMNCAPEALAQDLFCKLQKGMGAKNTVALHYLEDGKYEWNETPLDLQQAVQRIAETAPQKVFLVQPWLRNHAAIADLARDSLITFRLVTCLNENNEPELCLAMLRLLSSLEPAWQFLPDGEYAAPIDLESGVMGEFLGDSFATSHVHLTQHPVTHAKITGRVVPEWQALIDIAIKAHNVFSHRIVIGWDIALTPQGPVLLEGNSNFDVMFLQRVHQLPLGQTRLGRLLALHMTHISAMT